MNETEIVAEIKDDTERIWLCFFLAFLLGAVAATISKCIGAPFERIKMFQQCLYGKKSTTKLLRNGSENEKYPSTIIGIAIYIFKTQGFLSFWRGNLANCLRYVPKFALDMAFKQQLRTWFGELINPGSNSGLQLLSKWLSGSVAAMISTIICYPLDFARTRLGTDVEKTVQFHGIFDCWKKTIRNNGFFAIYSGLVICLIGDVIYRGLKYTFYDALKPVTNEWSDSNVSNFFINWISGWIISGLAGTIAMPLDTVKRIMMTNPKENTNSIKCCRELVKEHGITRLWRGTIANLIRSWSSGLTLALFSLLEDFIFKTELAHCKH